MESGSCHGRGFSGADPNGFLAKFKTWIETAPGVSSGGPGWTIIDDQSAAVSNPYIVVCDIAAPVVNDYNTGMNGGPPKFVQVGMTTTQAGYIYCKSWCWWDVGTSTGRGQWNGYLIATYDDADFAYDFRGGDDCLIIQARTGSSWATFVLSEWTGDANLVQGTGVVGVLDGGVTSGSNKVLQLHTGEGANFADSLNKYCYIYDFVGHTWVNYVKITDISNIASDQITVDTLGYAFPDGSVIGAYVHRWVSCGNGTWDNNNYNYANCVFPYYSGAVGYVFHNQTGTIYSAVQADYAGAAINHMCPDDEGVYAVMRPGLCEYGRPNSPLYTGSYTDGMNREYGIVNKIYCTKMGTMSAGLDGRIIGGNQWLFFKSLNALFYSGDSAIATLFLDARSV
jgi:hypothetical protein